MDQTWVNKIICSALIVTFVCLNCGCSGDDSCGYDVVGYVKSSIDSLPIPNVNVALLYYDCGGKEKGNGSSIFTTDTSGCFSWEAQLTPQRAYKCPYANEIEIRFRFEKSGFATVDTVFAKGAITDGGISERGRNILILPTVYLKQL